MGGGGGGEQSINVLGISFSSVVSSPICTKSCFSAAVAGTPVYGMMPRPAEANLINFRKGSYSHPVAPING